MKNIRTMKNYKTRMKQIIFMTLLALVSWSCIHENFDEPPVVKEYNYDFDVNTTIAGLKAMYNADKDTNRIDTGVVIKGVVISSDETGNFYKKIVLQDSTGGIEFQIDQYDLYLDYPVGTELLVKCGDLFIGEYAGVLQLGSSVELDGGYVNVVRMPSAMLEDVFYPTGNTEILLPDTVTISELNDDYVNTLIALKDMQFADGQAGNATYADAVNETTQNRTVVENKTNTTILLRNSGYASFAGDTLPEGSGVLVAVYGVFNSDQQLFIRDTEDVKFDQPRYEPGGSNEDIEANTTIAELKEMYDSQADTNKITTDVIIEGIVVSSDETGNFYKKLVLQDETGGIEFQIDQYDLYLDYPVGTELYVKCKGLYLGTYAGVIQVGGSIEKSGDYINVVRMTSGSLGSYFVASGNTSTPVPKVITIDNLSESDINTLVEIDNVQFVDGEAGNATYADAINQTTKNRTLVEYLTNNTIILRNSGYASFAAETLPEQSGKIIAIYSIFNSDQQLFIRDTEDVQFDQPRYTGTSGGDGEEQGTGTKDDPYNVLKAINNQSGTVWVEGYIVGCVNDISISTATFTSPFSATTNILLADDPDETDINNCVPVQLPSGDIRTALNLSDNTGNLKKQVMVKGELTAYFGVPGIKNVNGYWMDGAGVDPDYVPDGQIYKESFTSDISAYTAFDISGTANWYWASYGSGSAVANGYGKGTNEDWLVSPAISTSGYSTVTLQVSQAANYKTDWTTECHILVSNDYDGTSSPDQQGTWNEITFSTIPAGSDWNFVDSEALDISSYVSNDNIYVAFKYTNSDPNAATAWEVGEVILNGSN